MNPSGRLFEPTPLVCGTKGRLRLENGCTGKPKKLSRADMEDRLEYLNRLARGEVSDASVSTSDSSSEEDSSEEEVDSEDEEGVESRRLEEGAVPMGEATRYATYHTKKRPAQHHTHTLFSLEYRGQNQIRRVSV